MPVQVLVTLPIEAGSRHCIGRDFACDRMAGFRCGLFYTPLIWEPVPDEMVASPPEDWPVRCIACREAEEVEP